MPIISIVYYLFDLFSLLENSAKVLSKNVHLELNTGVTAAGSTCSKI